MQQARQQAGGSLVPDSSVGLIASVAAGFAAAGMSISCAGLDAGAHPATM